MAKTFCDFFIDFMQIFSLEPLFMKKVEQKRGKNLIKKVVSSPKAIHPLIDKEAAQGG